MRQRLLLGLGVATAALVTWYAFVPAGRTAQVVVAWIFIAAVHVCLIGVARSLARTAGLSASHRRFWWAVSASAVVYLIGDVSQIALAAAAPGSPAAVTGGPVQVVTLSTGSALLMLALLTLPLGFASRRERTRFWLDVAAVMSAAVVVGWYLIVPERPADLLDAAGPVLIGPVVLLLCVFVVAKLTMSGTAPFTRWCAGIGILGAGAKSAADAMAADGGVLGERLHWFLALTVASHALLTIAVRVNEVQVAGNPTVLTRQRRPYSLLPYGAIAITYLLLIVAVWRHQTATVPIALGGAALSTLLVVGRQLAAFRENARLLTELNDKVRELHETKSGLDALAGQLRHQAYHDTLSGLPNRALYAERLDAVLSSGAEAVVMVVDLDDFKLVNDEFGHAAGDALLRVLAGRILGCVRACDTVARLGGDEFAVLLAPGSDPLAVAARIVAAVEAPVEVDGGTAQVGASVGIATSASLAPAASPSASASPPVGSHVDGEAMLREADRAMYAAKRAGKGAYAIAP
jgi:diguanylate cyclase (GGDEF)-like protein